MSYQQLLQNLHFDADPFAHTNADEEDRLEAYFIDPPFFNAVYGSLDNPKSCVVFAPRGGGKTALKRKIELFSQSSSFLCVTYNQFNVSNLRLSQIDSDYHLKNIIRLILIGILPKLEHRGINLLVDDEKHFVYLFAKEYFSEITQTELKTAIDSIKNFKDKISEFWNKYTGPIGLTINILLELVLAKSILINIKQRMAH